MSDARPSEPTMEDIRSSLMHLAFRVRAERRMPHGEFISSTLLLIVQYLEQHIPGLEPPPNEELALAYMAAAERGMQDGQEVEAMANALRGLYHAPHHPHLWYLCATLSVELCGLECAMRLLFHALWLNPGHVHAQRDLKAYTASFGDQGETFHR